MITVVTTTLSTVPVDLVIKVHSDDVKNKHKGRTYTISYEGKKYSALLKSRYTKDKETTLKFLAYEQIKG